MSLNITPLTEIGKTVLDCAQIAVNTADLLTGFPLLPPDGSSAAPSYSFINNTDTGMFLDSGGVQISVDSEVGLVGAASGNVGIGGAPSTYGGGEGVVFLANAGVNPVGVPNAGAGGILYVDGANLNFLNRAGVVVTLSSAGASNVAGPVSSVDNNLAKFTSTTGQTITDSGITYASTQLLPTSGTSAQPAYSFISDTDTGVYLSGTSLHFSNSGVSILSLNSTATTMTVPFVGGSGGAVGAPVFSFASSPTTGMFYASDHIQLSLGGVRGVAVGGSGGTRNVSFAGGLGGYGTGADGVMFVPTATTDPVGVPNGGSGGVLYATAGGTQLRWIGPTGLSVLLGGSVSPVGTTVDGQIAVWGDTAGTTMVARSVVTDAGSIHAVQSATLTNPAYSFIGDTTTGVGLLAPGSVGLVALGVAVTSTTSAATSFNVQAEVAKTTASTPVLSFTSDATTGFYSESANSCRFTFNSTSECVDVGASGNVSLGEFSTDFGTGAGVVRMRDGTNPSTAPPDGGYLYVTGNDLVFRDTSNVTHTLTATSLVASIASSTNDAVVRYDGTGGKVVQDSVNLLLSDSGQITVVGAEGYAFTSSVTSGLESGGADSLRLVSAGTTSVTLTTAQTTVAAAHVLSGSNGTTSAPSFAFSSDPNTGVYNVSADVLGVAAGGVKVLSVDSNGNVSTGSDTPDYAGGQGVLYMSEVTTPPSGALSNGGILYVSGRSLYFHNQSGETNRLSGVEVAGSSTDNQIVTFASGGLGVDLSSTSGFTISDANIVTGPDGSGATPPYRVGASGDTGWFSSGVGVLDMGDGASQLSLSSTAVSSSVQLEVEGVVRVGGSGGMSESFSSPTTTRTVANASGVFDVQQNGTSILTTTTARDVNLGDNDMVFTGGTGDFRLQYDGTRFDLDVANAADTLDISVDGVVYATASSTNVTAANVSILDYIRSDNYVFTSSTNSGLIAGLNLKNNGLTGLSSTNSGRLGIFGAAPDGIRSVAVYPAVTAPTSLPTSGVYMYTDASAEFMRIANADADVAINGPNARAKISRTQTIATGAIDLIDTLTDVESHILVVDTASPGAGTVTGTAATAGWWEVVGEASWAANATGFRRIRIKVGGVVVADSTTNAVTTASTETQHQARACLNVAASAVVTFEVEQNSGGNLDVDVIGSVVFLG